MDEASEGLINKRVLGGRLQPDNHLQLTIFEVSTLRTIVSIGIHWFFLISCLTPQP
ncbi:hypothetical protein AN403_6174 [Pseudomonas fluorescens]|uniref:Uncharacterized protein n=1 Tax=Pseudomonas fluorescens TaxID=294 RepID=A0A0P8X7M3_PSEFL|nr:hypothetical protein AN403_6174 [Pseudomonas fluorescens]